MLALKDATMAGVEDLLTKAFEQRRVLVVGRSCVEEDACILRFKSEQQELSRTVSDVHRREDSDGDVHYDTTHGTATNTYESRYYVRLTGKAGVVRVEAFGVPVLGGKQSCPAKQPMWVDHCTPSNLTAQRKKTVAETASLVWHVDVSGTQEADTIGGVFAELSKALATEPTSPASAAEEEPGPAEEPALPPATPEADAGSSVRTEL